MPISSPYIIVEEDTRTRLIGSLGSWHFEPHKLPEEEVLACTYILFESLFRIEGMQEDAGVSLSMSPVYHHTYLSVYSACVTFSHKLKSQPFSNISVKTTGGEILTTISSMH